MKTLPKTELDSIVEDVVSENKGETITEWKDPSFYCNSPDYRFEVISVPGIRGGKPIVKGTRLTVEEVAAKAKRWGIDDVLEGFDMLNRDMVEKSIQYMEASNKSK